MYDPPCLEHSVREHLLRYLDDLGSSEPRDLQSMLEKAQGNQSRAAQMLGITRGTLRKKLQQHQISVDAGDTVPSAAKAWAVA